MTNCRVCQTSDKNKPQIFRGEDWCCDRHRKIIGGEIEPSLKEIQTMTQELYDKLINDAYEQSEHFARELG